MVNLKIVSQVVTTGTPGPAGKSAYQAAVDNGFEGTEKEWLESLLPFKGWYTSENDLVQKQPHPLFGDYAYVHTNSGTFLYHCTTNDGEGTWTNSGTQVDTSNINTFATSEPLNTVGISTDLSDAGQDEYLVKQSLIIRSMADMRCTSLGLDPIKEIPNFTPVNDKVYKVMMAHANETNEAVVFKMADTVAPLYYEGEAVSATNTWKDGEVIEIYYHEAALESADETCFYAHSILTTFATGESVGGVGIDATPTEGSENLLKSGGAKDAIDAIAEDMSELDERKANKDGVYSQMTVGAAETLVGQSVNSEEYLVRPTGGKSNEVANGIAEVIGLEGQSCVWNQLVDGTKYRAITQVGVTCYVVDNKLIFNGTTTGVLYYNCLLEQIPTIQNHRYLVIIPKMTPFRFYDDSNVRQFNNKYEPFIFDGSGESLRLSVRCDSDVTLNNVVVYYNIIDLTLLGIDNLATVAEVEEWLAQHVGTKPDYAYNPGTILSAQTLGIKTYGQNLLNPTTRQAKLIPYTWENNSNVYTIKNVPSGATATFTPDNTGVAVTVDISSGTLDITNYGSGILELSAATADTYVCMKRDGTKDDDVVPYEEHTYDFDIRKVYGKVNGAGNYVQCFPNGMKSVGTVHDTLTASEAVVKIGREVFDGTENWTSANVSNTIIDFGINGGISDSTSRGICNYYQLKNASGVLGTFNLKYFQITYLNIYEDITKYPNVTAWKSHLATLYANGTPLTIEYVRSNANTITYTNLVYRDNGVDTPLGEVLLQMQVNNWSMEEQLVTDYDNGNPTSIPATVNTIYSIDAVEALDTLQKTAYFEDDVHANLSLLLNTINTNCSTVLGGTFSVSDTATDKRFSFTFTPNAEPDVEPTNEGE